MEAALRMAEAVPGGRITRLEADEYSRIALSSLGINKGPRIALIYASGVIAIVVILLLSNHIGDLAVLRQAMAKARQGITPAGQDGVLRAMA